MKKQQLWMLYIIETKRGKLYTGITIDLERRYKEHCFDPAKGAKFFRSDKPNKIVYSESFDNRSDASKREQWIKKLSRAKKLQLINSEENES